jgi:hypothetical protein
MTPRPRPRLLLDLAFASVLVAISVTLIVLWLVMALFALQHALEPWNDAGVLLLGPVFVLLAALFGVPGSAWARSLAAEFALPWSRRALLTARIGSLTLKVGGVVAAAVLVYGVA